MATSDQRRSADALLRMLADRVTARLGYWDADLRCRYANRAYGLGFGIDPHVMLGMHMSDVLGPLYKLNKPQIEAALRGEPQEFERNIPDLAGGPPRPALANYIPDVFGDKVQGFFVLITDVSRIKEAERALQRREDERRVFVALLENSRDFIGIADPSGKPIYLNPAGRRMVGLSATHPVEETHLSDYYPPGERAFATNVILQSMLEHGSWSGETFLRNWKTEKAIPVSDEHFLIREPQTGRLLGMGSIIRDISESRARAREREAALTKEQRNRKKTEEINEQLRESEERFRLTIDEAPIGMALVAPDGRFIRVNHALCEIVGYTPEELTGLNFRDIIHPQDLNDAVERVESLARGEVPRYRQERRYLHKSGSVVEVMLSVSAVRARDGTTRYFIAQVEDVTDRKRLEDQQRFLAQAGTVLAATLDYDATLTRVAELAVQDLADVCIVDLVEENGQLRRAQVASRDPGRRWACDTLMRVSFDPGQRRLTRSALETMRTTLTQRPSQEVLASFAHSQEHLRALQALDIGSFIAAPLLAHGKLLGAVALVASRASRQYDPMDVELVEELARRAALSIENARLYQAARQAIQDRDDMMGVVAHDLRNPLSTIRMQASLLRRSGPEPERADAEVIDRAATRMNRLIQDLLDVARMEAGKLAIQPTPQPPERLILESLETQAPLAAAAAVELTTDIARGLPDVWADHDRILQVFENLIGNALKFTGRGGRVVVGGEPVEGAVQFRVADTGSGVAAEDVPHLFERFWRAHHEHPGAGLGLPIVQGIVEAHGGRVWAESTPGKGSTFFFTLPAAGGDLARLPGMLAQERVGDLQAGRVTHGKH